MVARYFPPRRFGRGKPPAYTGSIGAGNIEFKAPAPPTPWQLGRRAEQAARRLLRREGYTSTLTPFSHGAADIWAVKRDDIEGPASRLVQVKRLMAAPSWWANEPVRLLLRKRVGPETRREVWLHDGTSRGFVCRVVLGADGVAAVEGKEPWRGRTEAALVRVGLMP